MARPAPPEPVYFLDENLDSPEFEAALVEANMRCERLSKQGPPFRRGMPDAEWIPLVADRRWWGVTFDARTRKRPDELAALLSCPAVHIIIRGKQMAMVDRAAALVAARHRLAQRVPPLRPPVIVFVNPDGRIEIDMGKRRGGAR